MLDAVNVEDIRAVVEQTAAPEWYDHWTGGAEDEITVRANRAAYERIQFWPHVLRGVGVPSLATTLCGIDLEMPLLLSPTGMHGQATPEGELATARAAADMGCLMTVASGSSRTLEEIAALPGRRLFQLSLQQDRRVTEWLLRRAEAASYAGVVLTVDAAVLGRRERGIRSEFTPGEKAFANYALPRDPQSTASVIARDLGLSDVPTAVTYDPAQSWTDLEWFRGLTRLPLLVKGIVRPDDASRATDAGADAIWVSNHGGRQLDGTVATVDALPHVARAVAGRVPVVIDGGIRRGTDILKALALGARVASVGRPVMWGLAYDGYDGVRRVLEMLRTELEVAMALAGVPATDATAADILAPSSPAAR